MTKGIQVELCKMLILNGCEAVCENIDPLWRWEYDVAALSKSGLLHEYEVKISRSDFMADKKKRGKHEIYANYQTHPTLVPNYFSYVVPDGLVTKEEIPVYAGLFYYNSNGIRQIKPPKRIQLFRHKEDEIKKRMLRLSCQRTYLGSAMLTYKNKEAQRKHAEWLAKQTPETQQFYKNLQD